MDSFLERSEERHTKQRVFLFIKAFFIGSLFFFAKFDSLLARKLSVMLCELYT